MNSFLKYNSISLLWAALILLACLMPGRDLPDVSIRISDKAIHFIIYLFLSVFTYYGWMKQNAYTSLHRHTISKIVVITSAYGFIVEIMQHLFTADRHFDLMDALANSTGAVAGCVLCHYFKGTPPPLTPPKGENLHL